MGRAKRFEGIVRGMNEVLDCPLTVKMRTGIYSKTSTAHKLIPKLRDWGVSLVTVCGGSFVECVLVLLRGGGVVILQLYM